MAGKDKTDDRQLNAITNAQFTERELNRMLNRFLRGENWKIIDRKELNMEADEGAEGDFR